MLIVASYPNHYNIPAVAKPWVFSNIRILDEVSKLLYKMKYARVSIRKLL